MILGLLFSTVGSLRAQSDSLDTSWKMAVELGTGLSFTGYQANLAFLMRKGDHSLFAGPKLVYSDAYLLTDGPWGLHLGYRYRLAQRQRFQTYASLAYQVTWMENFVPNADGKNSVHEFHFAYGLEYQLGTRWTIGNSLGAGGYLERLRDPFRDRINTFNGFSAHVRLYLRYQLGG